jgi:hypothetical protein
MYKQILYWVPYQGSVLVQQSRLELNKLGNKNVILNMNMKTLKVRFKELSQDNSGSYINVVCLHCYTRD